MITQFLIPEILTNFAKIEESSEWGLRIQTGILSEPVAFEESKVLMSLGTFQTKSFISQTLCSVMGKGVR